MPVFQRTHAFQVNKSALEPLPIDTRMILDALGAQLNCSAIVDGLMFDWRSLFDSAWYDFNNLTIVGYHDSAGKEIKNCTTPGSSTILKPVQNGNKPDCRAPDIRFVRVTCSVDFSGLVTVANYGPTILRVGYYLELPQTTEPMTDANIGRTGRSAGDDFGPYQRMLNASRPFAVQERYPISVCDRFVQGLDRTILLSFHKMYPNYLLVHDLSGSYQHRMMSVILSAAQAAEDECKQFQDIARGMLGSQGFFASVSAGAGASIYASQAEQTLTKYSKDGKPIKRVCWGCGGDHTWMIKGVIMCPRKNEPQIDAGPRVFMLSLPVPVFNMTPPSRRTLPVPIQAAFPHITLQLGSSLGDSGCPAIRCVVDTAAAPTTGNLHFFAALAKAYPHTVASVHSPKDYSPIILSGIVQQGGSSVTTDLTVWFQFHLPYLTREGTPTSLVMATGPDVTMNAILGLPFITQTKMVIDTADQVVEMRAFDTPPFPIDFRRAMCAIPVIDEAAAAANAALHADIVAEIEAIKAHIYKKSAFFSRGKAPGNIPGSILMSSKRARVVDISDNLTIDGTASVATIGSLIDPFGNVLMDGDVSVSAR